MDIRRRLADIERAIDSGIDPEGLRRVLDLIGASGFPEDLIPEIHLYSEYLPKVNELGFTPQQRYLHFLWDILDRLPIAVVVDFSFLFRRIIAERLFKRCGKNFLADEGVRFNFGQNIEVGDDVFMNRNVFLDSKGGIAIGDAVGLGENADVFTHAHSESEHDVRTYGRVVIGRYAKVYSHATILPGVTVGERAIVAAKSLVACDVEPGMVVAGIPAKAVRERRCEGHAGEDLRHIWLKDGAFQGSTGAE
ncbi:MAG: acyltransferase [Candidatus Geothermincolia bacterium]